MYIKTAIIATKEINRSTALVQISRVKQVQNELRFTHIALPFTASINILIFLDKYINL